MAENLRINLGPVTSYGLAKSKGFSGTEDEWVQKLINSATESELGTVDGKVATVNTKVTNLTSQVTTLSAEVESDVAALNTEVNKKINTTTAEAQFTPKPETDGSQGDALRNNGDGTTSWAPIGLPTDEQTATAVSDWLDDHPEATTTVEDGAITAAKLNEDIKSDVLSIPDLKSAVNQLINQKTISATGSGNKYIDYPIENGKTYRFSIQSASTVTIATVSSTNTTIENVGSIAPPSGYIDFTATSDAPKVLMYFRAAGTGVISEKGLAISNINDEITAIKNRLTELDISVNSSGNNYFDYPVVSGKIYLVETSSSAVVSVATVTTGGATIQNVGDFPATANARKVFKASSNANRILFYFRAAGTGSIKPVDEMFYMWANKVWSSYGDSISWLFGWQKIVNNNLLFADYVRNGKPGARISWLNATFGIDSNGIYTTGTAADTVHESMCAYDRIAKTIPADIPLVFAMGGTNDFLSNIPLGDLTFDTTSETDTAWKAENPVGDYNITTFKGGLASMLMKLQHARPDALIVFGTLLNGIGAETGVNQYTEEVNTAGLKPSDYANAEKEVCAAFGVPVVDVFGTCGISVTNRATYLSDTVHPNGYGLNMLARCVTDGFKGIIPRY